jgi:hypothetical protein
VSRTQDFQALCPQCGRECTWTSTLVPADWQRDGTVTEADCTCGVSRT